MNKVLTIITTFRFYKLKQAWWFYKSCVKSMPLRTKIKHSLWYGFLDIELKRIED